MNCSLLAICNSTRKGHSKTPVAVAVATLTANHGIEGDVHAGNWHRQLSLLDSDDIDFMRTRGLPGLHYGSFAENLVIGGLDLAQLGIGSRLQLGATAQIRITQIGKECHTACAIMAKVGECIMPTRGLFAVVEQSGDIAVGDAVGVLKSVPRSPEHVLESFQV